MKAKRTDTFEMWLTHHYYIQFADDRRRGAGQTSYLLRRYVPEKFNKTQAHLITRRDVRAVVSPLLLKTPMLAKQLLSAMSSVFAWGVDQEVISHNPCTGIKRPKPGERSRVLSDAEVPLFWRRPASSASSDRRPPS